MIPVRPNTARLALIALLGVVMTHSGIAIEPGNVDPVFQTGAGVDGSVTVVVTQPDGKILIGGYFTAVDGMPRRGIARLMRDGAVDPLFVPAIVAGNVRGISANADGQVTIAGWFTFDNARYLGVARLNADGSVDPLFRLDAQPNDQVFGMAAQCDGQVVIGGSFTQVGSSQRNRLARIRPDGSLDQNFNPNSNERVFSISIANQADGRIVVGGFFTRIGGVDRSYAARLLADGTIDPAFAREGAPGSGVLATAMQSDGSAVIAGSFLRVGTVPRSGVARFLPDGALDTSFDPGQGSDASLNGVALQIDGKVLIAGQFTTVAGRSRSGIARLNVNGSLDESFDPGAGTAGSSARAVALQPDGGVVVGGDFTTMGGLPRVRVARLYAGPSHGMFDVTFSRCTGPENTVLAAVVQPDNKIVVGGFFNSIDGVSRNNIARVNADGTLDPTFDPGTGTDGLVASLALEPDGDIIVGGGFLRFNGVSRYRVMRLKTTGALDTTFANVAMTVSPVGDGPPIVRAVAVQRNGKVLIGGRFTTVGGVLRQRLARLHSNGKLDTRFNAGRVDQEVLAIALDEPALGGAPFPDAKVLVAGAFQLVGGLARNQVARLYPNGRIDNTFLPGRGPEGLKSAIALQADGKVLVGGSFPRVGTTLRNGIARLHPTGALDTTFVSDTGERRRVFTIVPQTDGSVLAGGYITATSSGEATGRSWLARLLPTGAEDPAFRASSGYGAVSSISTQSDGRVVVGGYFRMSSPLGWKFLARVNP